MSSDTAASNIQPVNGQASDAESAERVIGGRATADEIYLIDRAALEVGKARGPFIVDAAVEKARTVLAAKATLESSPAA